MSLFLIAALAASVVGAPKVSPVGVFLKNGDLRRRCAVAVSAPDAHELSAECLGYVFGVIDSQSYIANVGHASPPFCPKMSTEPVEMVFAVRQHVMGHRGDDGGFGVETVVQALSASFPCAGRAGTPAGEADRTAKRFSYADGERLKQMCAPRKGAPMRDLDMRSCRFYLAGVFDAFVDQGFPTDVRPFCYASIPTLEGVATIVMDRLKDPAQTPRPAAQVVSDALFKAYPCAATSR